MTEIEEIKKNLSKLEERIGVTFRDHMHLLTAVTHRSYLNEHREADQDHNERYEFLGDAILELVVTDFLFRKYPEKPEGELTAVRAALVNTVSLAEASTKIEVNEFLLLSKGEEKDTGRARQYILANAFEALIGAIYLDQGYEAAATFVGNQLFNRTERIVEKRLWQDAKSRFQELSQEHVSVTPSYETIGQTGPDHDRIFTVGVFLGGTKVAEGKGRSKQEAEQEAAEKAIEAKVGNNTPSPLLPLWYHTYMRFSRGFTIVELTVIVAVVAVLATVVMGNIQEARAVARDKERMVMLDQMSLSLRLYKEQYGRYPERGCPTVKPSAVWASPGPGDATWYAPCDEYIPGVVPDLISSLPVDSAREDDNNFGIMYRTDSQGRDYKLMFHGSVETGSVVKGEPYARCPASCSQTHCTQSSYAVYTPGAACW